MTKPRPRRNALDPSIDLCSWDFLHDATTLDDEREHSWQLISLSAGDDASFHPDKKTARELWNEHGKAVLSWWVKANPGTRPKCWWRFEAPEPRKRVGGRGALRSEVWGMPPYIANCGLPSPDGFVTADDTAATAAGYEAADPAHPPLFESQPAYLKRLGLFAPEERRVPRGALAPEVIEVEYPRRRGPHDHG
ncbi:MAG: hypothetical protein K0R41_3207 [Geminicoccaceae bacterium]|jgi:hypothetical protein|nr:hypothetical protein [Microvirga sp.]MCE3249382.1 hypothetical protein [Geminicoccaceae bacterium]